jgi:hypothetical protein
MGTKKILAVAAIALCPAIALGQARSDTTAKATGQDTAQKNVTSTSTGAIASESTGANRTMNKGQDDANVIGTPAWWKTRSTADGKPLGAGGNAKPQRSDSSKRNKKP